MNTDVDIQSNSSEVTPSLSPIANAGSVLPSPGQPAPEDDCSGAEVSRFNILSTTSSVTLQIPPSPAVSTLSHAHR